MSRSTSRQEDSYARRIDSWTFRKRSRGAADEDAGLLAGAGRFTDDFSLPGQTYLSFLRSPYAHARIVSIDATAAASMPGVLGVLTGADLVAAGVKPLPVEPMFQRPDGSPGATPLRPALADERCPFRGGGGVALIAETAEQAKDALEAVVVEYEDLPVVTELTEAAARARRWFGRRPPETSQRR